MKTEKFQRKPFIVDAVQVTEENMKAVAEWCKGTVKETDPQIAEQLKKPVRTWIQVDTQQPMNDRQQQAFVGDWVLYANRGFKIYTPKAFERTFESVFVQQKGTNNTVKIHVEKPSPAAVAAARKVSRSAESGEFVSQAEADANPSTTVTETVEVAPTGQAEVQS